MNMMGLLDKEGTDFVMKILLGHSPSTPYISGPVFFYLNSIIP